MKAFFSSFLEVSSDFMGLASRSMLYRAGEVVGKAFSHLSPEELTEAFENVDIHVVIQDAGGQWTFVVNDSVETSCSRGEYEPCCHMFRGFFAAYIQARSRNPYLRCIETDCTATGSDFCMFVVSP